MNKHMQHLIPFFFLISALILAAGCVTITVPSKDSSPSTKPQETLPVTTTPTAQGDLPTIISFTASPDTIAAGQMATLSWNVADATIVSIKPSVGNVGLTGSQQVSPNKTTTYAMTATNASGDTTRTITLTVTAAEPIPDLVITEVTMPGSIISYKVYNQGGGTSPGSVSYLYLNDVKVSTDYIQPLAPGEERLESFSNYTAPPSQSQHAATEVLASITQTIKVCADAENATKEINEDNNCLTIILGPEFIYDFVENAHLAIWRSGAGELKWPMVGSDTKGAAFLNHLPLEDGSTYSNTLATYPQKTQLGSIQGNFGQVYAASYQQQTRLVDMTVPLGARFSAKVGFAKGAEATQGATVQFGIIDPSGSQIILQMLDVYYDGMLDDIQVDLSNLANKKVYFFLRVESKSNGANDWVVWVEPKVTSKP